MEIFVQGHMFVCQSQDSNPVGLILDSLTLFSKTSATSVTNVDVPSYTYSNESCTTS